MSKFAKELGFFMISIIFVSIPFFTGLRLGIVGEIDFLVLCGLIITLLEIGCLMSTFICISEWLDKR